VAKPAQGDEKEAASPLLLEPARCGFIALIGAPNVGKSTFLNALVGAKVSIVSHKVQTTRMLVRGIAAEGAAQLVLIDTPGLFPPKRRLDRAMVTTAWGVAHEADLICLIVDAKAGVNQDTAAILKRLTKLSPSKFLILNKIDLIDKPQLLTLAASLNQAQVFDATFMVSALTGDGMKDVRGFLAARVPAGPWHYPADQLSDAPLRLLAAELTREQLYLRLNQELPYHSTVETDTWSEQKDGSVRIEQTIFVERPSQRKIVLGSNGQTIKAIGAEARRAIAQNIEAPVHLFLFVKVRENWEDDPERYHQMGLEFPDT
jgi:GTP-binding protein Era